MIRKLLLILAVAAGATGVGCKTTQNTGGYDYYRSHDPGVSDGAPYRDPGDVQRAKNASGAFHL